MPCRAPAGAPRLLGWYACPPVPACVCVRMRSSSDRATDTLGRRPQLASHLWAPPRALMHGSAPRAGTPPAAQPTHLHTSSLPFPPLPAPPHPLLPRSWPWPRRPHRLPSCAPLSTPPPNTQENGVKHPSSKELIEPILSEAFVETERRLRDVGRAGPGQEGWGRVGRVVNRACPWLAGWQLSRTPAAMPF